MKAILVSPVICPKCGHVMEVQQEQPQLIFCDNKKCIGYGTTYQPPKVELVPTAWKLKK